MQQSINGGLSLGSGAMSDLCLLPVAHLHLLAVLCYYGLHSKRGKNKRHFQVMFKTTSRGKQRRTQL